MSEENVYRVHTAMNSTDNIYCGIGASISLSNKEMSYAGKLIKQMENRIRKKVKVIKIKRPK